MISVHAVGMLFGFLGLVYIGRTLIPPILRWGKGSR